jgi:hypothetical protein
MYLSQDKLFHNIQPNQGKKHAVWCLNFSGIRRARKQTIVRKVQADVSQQDNAHANNPGADIARSPNDEVCKPPVILRIPPRKLAQGPSVAVHDGDENGATATASSASASASSSQGTLFTKDVPVQRRGDVDDIVRHSAVSSGSSSNTAPTLKRTASLDDDLSSSRKKKRTSLTADAMHIATLAEKSHSLEPDHALPKSKDLPNQPADAASDQPSLRDKGTVAARTSVRDISSIASGPPTHSHSIFGRAARHASKSDVATFHRSGTVPSHPLGSDDEDDEDVESWSLAFSSLWKDLPEEAPTCQTDSGAQSLVVRQGGPEAGSLVIPIFLDPEQWARLTKGFQAREHG